MNAIEHIEKLHASISELNNSPSIHEDVREILDLLLKNLRKFIENKRLQTDGNYFSLIRLIYSHLEAVAQFIKRCNKSPNEEIQNKIECIIQKLEENLIKNEPSTQQTNAGTPNGTGLIVQNEDNFEKEKFLPKEQMSIYALNNNIFRQKLLFNTWKFVLDEKEPLATKKVFISYAWPIGDQHGEAWIKEYIKNIAADLTYAGIRVFIDEYDSGPGYSLKKHMDCIAESDHILFISSRTMGYKLTLDVSGVKYEYNEDQKAITEK